MVQVTLLHAALLLPRLSPAAAPAAPAASALIYTNDVDPKPPMSAHIIKVPRAAADLRFVTTYGKGRVLGMDTVSEQLKTLPPELGLPLAAINGDFYHKIKGYEGRPRDVQIRQGEVVSSPSGHTSFWIDTQGQPRMTNVTSRFRVVWPDGTSTPMGLNQYRTNDAAVLFTAAVGSSTRATGGLEYLLAPAPGSPGLPLRIGQTYSTIVRNVSRTGNTRLDAHTLVLSVGPKLVPKLSTVRAGATLKLITETVPDLSGVDVAIGGGPALVLDGKAQDWKGLVQVRHPRTALGWNKDYIFLVVVDGRQIDISIGMTLPELAAYMEKLGCEQALNLDGGGSATLWAFGSVKNSPSEGQERPAPNALVVVRKKS
jgi:hypothetical protein